MNICRRDRYEFYNDKSIRKDDLWAAKIELLVQVVHQHKHATSNDLQEHLFSISRVRCHIRIAYSLIWQGIKMRGYGMKQAKKTVVVIGAGIVGATVALRLVENNYSVKLIDSDEPGGEQAASYGNGAWISPASIIPMTSPGIWKKVPGYLLDPTGPLTIRPWAIPKLLPWLIRFMNAGSTEKKVSRTARILNTLIHDAPERHLALAKKIGYPELVVKNGLIYAYPDRRAFEEEKLSWRLRRENGVGYQELDNQELHEKVPWISDTYQFAIYVPNAAHSTDPGALNSAIARYAEKQGAEIIRAKAIGFGVQHGKLQSIVTDNGTVPADFAVICAGIHSRILAAQAGDNVIMESERGYHVEIDNPGLSLDIPVMPSDGKMANTMIGNKFRASGQVELCSVTAQPNWKRADILMQHLLKTYPRLKENEKNWQIKHWFGHRPSTPDGLPVIGAATGIDGVFYAFGHGHIGLNSAPKTAELVELMLGEKFENVADFSPTRF